jgi:NAD(P)-dependent dehydrogenase (short-subunit alcohol dehydrogenase family)
MMDETLTARTRHRPSLTHHEIWLPFPVLSLGFALVLTLVHPDRVPAQASSPKAVLVTGASTGIGRKITERLASKGVFVYAGARSQKDLEDLNTIKNVQAVRLDVTVPADIAAAVETVKKGGKGLYGVVNNAGIAVVAPLVEVDDKDMESIVNVNMLGPYRITKAFAPMLFESKGRVVNISSLNGIVASPMIGPYSMTKHAIEAYGDGLAAELARFGVKVSLIEPGNYGTDIGKSVVARTDTNAYKGSRFEAQMRSALNSMRSFESYPPPDDVADAVYDALTNDNPKLRYLVVPAQNQAAIAIRKLIDEVVQLNQDQKFSYDRDALVKMLDDALARSKQKR